MAHSLCQTTTTVNFNKALTKKGRSSQSHRVSHCFRMNTPRLFCLLLCSHNSTAKEVLLLTAHFRRRTVSLTPSEHTRVVFLSSRTSHPIDYRRTGRTQSICLLKKFKRFRKASLKNSCRPKASSSCHSADHMRKAFLLCSRSLRREADTSSSLQRQALLTQFFRI